MAIIESATLSQRLSILRVLLIYSWQQVAKKHSKIGIWYEILCFYFYFELPFCIPFVRIAQSQMTLRVVSQSLQRFLGQT